MSNPFNIVGQETSEKGRPYEENSEGLGAKERIEKMIASTPIFLFMKGVPDFPQCGFSANVIAILNSLDIKYSSFDVLSDMDIRQGIKDFSNWPTIPQLYVNGEFIGGCDIITEMYQKGELQSLLAK
ncbi:MAG: Grx4 family monothiol glutaredoxin [Bacteriovoracaceae bacterium]